MEKSINRYQEMYTIHERRLNLIPFRLKCSSPFSLVSASLSRLLLERAHLFSVHDLFVYFCAVVLIVPSCLLHPFLFFAPHLCFHLSLLTCLLLNITPCPLTTARSTNPPLRPANHLWLTIHHKDSRFERDRALVRRSGIQRLRQGVGRVLSWILYEAVWWINTEVNVVI